MHVTWLHIYMAHSPCFPSTLASSPLSPFASPLCPLLLTWHPPAVTGMVHLPLRLLVNWPRLPHPSPNWPTLTKFPEPHLPRAYNDDLGNIPALAIWNMYCESGNTGTVNIRSSLSVAYWKGFHIKTRLTETRYKLSVSGFSKVLHN